MVRQKQSEWNRKRAWAEIDLDALSANIKKIRNYLQPNCSIMAMVKANAYGHGDIGITRHLESIGIHFFGVSELEEGIILRRNGRRGEILICTPIAVDYVTVAAKYNLTITVPSISYAMALDAAAEKQGVQIDIHIKLDTGMNRIGFLAYGEYMEQSFTEILAIQHMPHLRLQGIFTHFACADSIDTVKRKHLHNQHYNFKLMVDKLQQAGCNTGVLHCSNSGATITEIGYQLDMVRIGIMMYGYAPGDCGIGRLSLQPVMSIHARIHHIKQVDAGQGLSYGITYIADKPTIVATIGLGYADGYPRRLSNHSYMLYKGVRCPVIGNVCMDQIMLDISNVPVPRVGDFVTVVGKSGEKQITWEHMASLANTIDYELICAVGRRLPRIYTSCGKDVQITTYQNLY